jgi:hypothetical protein
MAKPTSCPAVAGWTAAALMVSGSLALTRCDDTAEDPEAAAGAAGAAGTAGASSVDGGLAPTDGAPVPDDDLGYVGGTCL